MSLSRQSGKHICGGDYPRGAAPHSGITVQSGHHVYSGPTPGPKGKGSTAKHRGNNGMISPSNGGAWFSPMSGRTDKVS